MTVGTAAPCAVGDRVPFTALTRPAGGGAHKSGRTSVLRRTRPWAVGLVAGLAATGLLWKLMTVVQQAVSQGDATREAAALRVEADWRCRALSPKLARERCLLLVQERKPADSMAIQSLVSEAAAFAQRR
jgi:hypothetical protein